MSRDRGAEARERDGIERLAEVPVPPAVGEEQGSPRRQPEDEVQDVHRAMRQCVPSGRGGRASGGRASARPANPDLRAERDGPHDQQSRLIEQGDQRPEKRPNGVDPIICRKNPVVGRAGEHELAAAVIHV